MVHAIGACILLCASHAYALLGIMQRQVASAEYQLVPPMSPHRKLLRSAPMVNLDVNGCILQS